MPVLIVRPLVSDTVDVRVRGGRVAENPATDSATRLLAHRPAP
jgi:hypothetical protein